MRFDKKKRWTSVMVIILLVSVGILLGSMLLVSSQPPTPYTVNGRVLTNSSNGVQNGLTVRINNSDLNQTFYTFTNAPPIPSLRGSYFTTILGRENDTLIVHSWNATHFGENKSNLSATTTTNVNVVLNMTRDSEANVTILTPVNDSLFNKSIVFNVTANVTIIGNDGTNCNATISFSNTTVLNVSTGGNLTNELGDISRGDHVVTTFLVRGVRDGTSNISVLGYCESDGIILERENRKTLVNITSQNLAPQIQALFIQPLVDLIPGDNLTLQCNVSIFEPNTVDDVLRVNATLYHNDTLFSDPNDFNTHYANSSCTNVSSNVMNTNYSCSFSVRYFADNGLWHCNATAIDRENVTAFDNTSTIINEMLAISIPSGIIDYGALQVTNISADDVNVTMQNAGNIDFNVSVRGFAPNESLAYLNLSMNCDVRNISNANQRYSISPSTDFADMTRLNNESEVLRNITLAQRTNDIIHANDTNTSYWKLQIPALRRGNCNGSVVFTALPT